MGDKSREDGKDEDDSNSSLFIGTSKPWDWSLISIQI